MTRRLALTSAVWCFLAGNHADSQGSLAAPPSGMVAAAIVPSSHAAVPAEQTAVHAVPRPRAADAFFGEADGPIREALSTGEIAAIEKGRGGRSLAFRITLNNGQKGYFKPEQSFSASNWYAEVAAYHLDRLLGLGRVPAVVSRVFPWKALEPVAGKDPRKSEVTARDGQVVGAFVAWVHGGLRPMAELPGWEHWLRIDHLSSAAVNPYQRQVLWKRDAALARNLGSAWRSAEDRAALRRERSEPDRVDRPAELSDLIVFDFLTRNLDRWGGENANVLVRGPKGPLVFLDNSAGFEPGNWLPDLCRARLEIVQRLRRSTIAAVRALDLKAFEARLSGETVTPVLPRTQIQALAARRKVLLEYVAALEAAHGEAIWAWE